MEKIKIDTLKTIVKRIADEAPNFSPGSCEIIANEAAIYYKMAIICEKSSIEDALAYFTGTHNGEEYKEFVRNKNERKD